MAFNTEALRHGEEFGEGTRLKVFDKGLNDHSRKFDLFSVPLCLRVEFLFGCEQAAIIAVGPFRTFTSEPCSDCTRMLGWSTHGFTRG